MPVDEPQKTLRDLTVAIATSSGERAGRAAWVIALGPANTRRFGALGAESAARTLSLPGAGRSGKLLGSQQRGKTISLQGRVINGSGG